jgi:hypothetical protein
MLHRPDIELSFNWHDPSLKRRADDPEIIKVSSQAFDITRAIFNLEAEKTRPALLVMRGLNPL